MRTENNLDDTAITAIIDYRMHNGPFSMKNMGYLHMLVANIRHSKGVTGHLLLLKEFLIILALFFTVCHRDTQEFDVPRSIPIMGPDNLLLSLVAL